MSSKEYQQVCQMEQRFDEDTGTPEDVERCATIFNELGRDDLYQLHLKRNDARLLGLTRRVAASLNPDIDDMGELAGQVVLILSMPQPEYQNNVADNQQAFDIVFMVPDADTDATDADTDDAGTGNADGQVENGWGAFGPYPYTSKRNRRYQSFGNPWFGAAYQFSNTATYDKVLGVPYKNHSAADHWIRATLLRNRVDILSVDGSSDFGADKGVSAWRANASVRVFGYTVLSASFDPSFCSEENNITACQIFENEGGIERDRPPKKKGRSLSMTYKLRFMAGPVPLLIQADIGLTSGLVIAGHFVIDGNNSDFDAYGMQLKAGPYVKIDTTVFGGVSVGLARAGVEGRLSIVNLSLTPTLRPTFGVQYDVTNDCLMRAETRLAFEGPLTLTGPSGCIAIVAYVGTRFCVWGGCWNIETKVFSLTIAQFSSWTKTWMLWKTEPVWRKNPSDFGMCVNATGAEVIQWRTPTSCGGRYCRNTSTQWIYYWPRNLASVKSPYKKTVTYSGCVDVRVAGSTERWYDRAYVYNSSGNVVNGRWGWSGRFDNNVRDCSGSTTVSLEADYAIQRSGLNVTFTMD